MQNCIYLFILIAFFRLILSKIFIRWDQKVARTAYLRSLFSSPLESPVAHQHSESCRKMATMLPSLRGALTAFAKNFTLTSPTVASTRLYATKVSSQSNKMANPKCFFDVSINNVNAGRVVMEVTLCIYLIISCWKVALDFV